MTLSAMNCIAQGGAFSGDIQSCGGGGHMRVDGDQAFPCVTRARTVRDTWLCPFTLPPNSVITSIVASVYDTASDGYMEALPWRIDGIQYVGHDLFGNFGGVWQTSGTAFNSGVKTFSIFNGAHTVFGNYQYVIGFGMKSPSGQTIHANGFRISYTVP
jgi:hypothetical protein